MNNVKGKNGVDKSYFHPYAGMIRIRLEGIISACNTQTPLEIGCKGSHYFLNNHEFS